jgi:hypothetical protein
MEAIQANFGIHWTRLSPSKLKKKSMKFRVSAFPRTASIVNSHLRLIAL